LGQGSLEIDANVACAACHASNQVPQGYTPIQSERQPAHFPWICAWESISQGKKEKFAGEKGVFTRRLQESILPYFGFAGSFSEIDD
jgi:hypothetical protein